MPDREFTFVHSLRTALHWQRKTTALLHWLAVW